MLGDTQGDPIYYETQWVLWPVILLSTSLTAQVYCKGKKEDERSM